MAEAKTGARAKKPALPPVTGARFDEAMALVERLVQENASMFIARGQDYREQHRDGTSRPLNAVEVAQIAAGLGTDLQTASEQIAAAGLEHHDEPEPREVLLAAGIGTAPAFMRAVLSVVALIELPADEFRDARKAGTIAETISAIVEELLDEHELAELRARASGAMEHLAAASGVEPGKAWATIGQSVWKALELATDQLAVRMRSSSSIGSATPTADSPPTTSSTS